MNCNFVRSGIYGTRNVSSSILSCFDLLCAETNPAERLILHARFFNSDTSNPTSSEPKKSKIVDPETRLEICGDCPHARTRSKRTSSFVDYCDLCKCPLETKVWFEFTDCPDGRWTADEPSTAS